jgi:hypothetical protein
MILAHASYACPASPPPVPPAALFRFPPGTGTCRTASLPPSPSTPHSPLAHRSSSALFAGAKMAAGFTSAEPREPGDPVLQESPPGPVRGRRRSRLLTYPRARCRSQISQGLSRVAGEYSSTRIINQIGQTGQTLTSYVSP